jgi:hypothetical protein
VLLLEQVERQALADQVDVWARQAAFDEWLNADPNDSEEARAARHIAELTGAA